MAAEARRLTLSFDNGPDPDTTPRILGMLAARGIRTTFFMVGQQLAAAEGHGLPARVQAAGHWVGNHTWSHRPALGERTGPGVAEAEIGATQALLGPSADPRKLFRPSGGGGNLDDRLLNAECFDYLRDGGYSCITWHSVPGDLKGVDWVPTALEHIEQRPWTLMVLHDIPRGCVSRLEEFLDAVERRGNVEIVQDFPPDCVLMDQGRVVQPMDAYVRRA